MSNPHRARSVKSDAVPTLVAAVCLDTQPATSPGYEGSGGLVFARAAIVAHRRAAGKWVHITTSRADSPGRLWEILDTIGQPGKRVYCVCPGAADSLTMAGWWGEVAAGRFTVWRRPKPRGDVSSATDHAKGKAHPLIVSGNPDVIGYSSAKCSYRWVGTRQFGEPEIPSDLDCLDRAEWVSDWIRSIMSSWVGAGCGRWCDTGGAASWMTYRRIKSACPIQPHSKPDVVTLESAACHGGRAAVWFFGAVGTAADWKRFPGAPKYPTRLPALPGPVHRVDIRACYPTLMRDRTHPTRHVGVRRNLTPKTLAQIVLIWDVIARVKLYTTAPEYPRASGGSAAYPVGTFWTTLATPEILTAIEDGSLIEVGAVSLYERGRPFAEWGDWILSRRTAAAHHPNTHWSRYVKAVSVALSGRLAQRKGGWRDRPKLPARREWGPWLLADLDGNGWREFRALGGHTQEREKLGPRTGTLAACYAHVMSYGRVQMRRLRELTGYREVIAQHTDGLVVTSLGLRRLHRAGALATGDYGTLRTEGEYRVAWYRGPNHFWSDGKWTLSGIVGGWVDLDDGRIVESVHVNPARGGLEPLGSMIRERLRVFDPATIDIGVKVGRDGWAIPPTVRRPGSA